MLDMYKLLEGWGSSTGASSIKSSTGTEEEGAWSTVPEFERRADVEGISAGLSEESEKNVSLESWLLSPTADGLLDCDDAPAGV